MLDDIVVTLVSGGKAVMQWKSKTLPEFRNGHWEFDIDVNGEDGKVRLTGTVIVELGARAPRS